MQHPHAWSQRTTFGAVTGDPLTLFSERVFHWPAAYQNRLGWLARESRDPRVSDSVVVVEQLAGTYHAAKHQYGNSHGWIR